MNSTDNTTTQSEHWQTALREHWNIDAKLSQLDGEYDLNFLAETAQADGYILKVMRTGCADDPLLLQVLPQNAEHTAVSGFSTDPVGDLQAQKTTGLLHKYTGRVLLVATGVCAIHCRYCFRREYPYENASATQSQWQSALDYIAADASITEVILSGGDPLSAPLAARDRRNTTARHVEGGKAALRDRTGPVRELQPPCRSRFANGGSRQAL